MDPIEAGDWIAGRPLQLVFLSGLDPANKPHHNAVVGVFRNRTTEKPPLQIRVVSGELDIPPKREEKGFDKGILRREWPLKYLDKVPALIVVFIDLEWNHPSWDEKKTEAESKVASIRASLRHGTKVALVLIQQKSTSVSDNLAADRAHELCQACALSSKQLFILPADNLLTTQPNTNLQSFVLKLESAFHELCQAFYQQRSVASGLSALATLNPGTHLDQAASIYATANTEISALKRNAPQNVPYPNPDPLANASSTIFFGQRPWRIQQDGLASAETEAAAVNAITQRLVVNHEGVISLLSAALAQYQKYGCMRMKKKVMMEMANTCYANNEIQRALRFWGMVIKDGALPYTIRKDMMHRATWAAYAIASVQDFAVCCMQLMCPAYSEVLPSDCVTGLMSMLEGRAPGSPFPNDDVSKEQLQAYQAQWQQVIQERPTFTVHASKIAELFLDTRVSFLDEQTVEQGTKVAVRIELLSKIDQNTRLNNVTVYLKSKKFPPEPNQTPATEATDSLLYDPISLGSVEISGDHPMKRVIMLDLKDAKQNWIVTVTKVVLDIGGLICGQIEFDENALNRNCHVENIVGLEFLKIGGEKTSITLENNVNVNCLIGEVTSTELTLRNNSKHPFQNLQLDFKRQDQKHTEAAAVLFVEREGNELKSEFSMKICDQLGAGEMITIPLMFSAQLIGDYVLQLELNYKDNQHVAKSTILEVGVVANEPFSVTSNVMNMNGIPMSSILNNCEHVLSVSIESAAPIIINSIEFLMADVVTLCDTACGGSGKILNDAVNAEETICYSAVIKVLVKEDESETPLGRMSVEWRRATPNSCPVRSVVPLCRIPVFPCPISIVSCIKSNPAVVRQPIDICFELTNHSKEVIEISTNFDLNDVFMFSGERKITLTVLPGATRRVTVVVMALSAGRLNFPKISLKSAQVTDQILQQSLRTLPATIFVLPKSKEFAQQS